MYYLLLEYFQVFELLLISLCYFQVSSIKLNKEHCAQRKLKELLHGEKNTEIENSTNIKASKGVPPSVLFIMM